MALVVPRRLGIALIVLLALAGLGAGIAYGAISPVGFDDGTAVRLWKRTSVRLVVEGLALGYVVAGRAEALDDGGDPFFVPRHHPYLQRIRLDPRTRRFYPRGRRALDVADYAAMTDFLRDAFEHGLPVGWHYQFHVLEMLDARAFGAKIACGEITRMLIQLVQAGGGWGRRVQLDGHVVAEVWSREHGKWVAMDADYDVWFSDRAGTPLSVWEIHERVRSDHRDDLVPHVGASRAALFRSQPEALYRSYERGFAVVHYAQWVTRDLPTWHPGRNPVLRAHAYYPEPTLEQRIYFRHLTDDPASLYAPPAGATTPDQSSGSATTRPSWSATSTTRPGANVTSVARWRSPASDAGASAGRSTVKSTRSRWRPGSTGSSSNT